MGAFQKIAAFFVPREPVQDVHPLDRWTPGDMAECIHYGPWYATRGRKCIADLERGHVSMVHDVRPFVDRRGEQRIGLAFGRWPGVIFDARGFRRLQPRAEAIVAADLSFTERLKLGRVPAPSLADRLAARLEGILS